jgi:DNA-binding transcriptional ArsR family regulator
MSLEETAPGEFELTDPRAIRALAHPARLALMDRLLTGGPATATQCAAAVGGTPSSCSYHLRALAKFGFVEEAGGGRGRERLWRIRARSIRLPRGEKPRDHTAAADLLLSRFLELDDLMLATFMNDRDAFDPPWRDALTYRQGNVYVTPDELMGLANQVRGLLQTYARDDPADRPEGARLVYVSLRAVPRQAAP